MSYQSALDLLPRRKSPELPAGDDTEPNHANPSRPTDHDEIDSKSNVGDELEANSIVEPGGEEVAATDTEKTEVVRLRSMLHANIGACQVKLVSGHWLTFRRVVTLTGVRGSTRKQLKHVHKVHFVQLPIRYQLKRHSVEGRS